MKTQKVSADYIFVTGAARFRDLVYLCVQDKELCKDDVVHSRLVAFDQGELAPAGDVTNWNTAAMCVVKKPKEKMIAISEDGDVLTYVGGSVKEEVIKPKPTVLRGMGVVDGYAVVCGMKRQVYKRTGENSWTAMHAPAPAAKENAGFEDICGFSEKEMYAAGWEGEIWEWDGSKWLNRASPTNVILTGICCGGDEKVYVCGQDGTLIRGRHGVWEIIELENMTDDFWDVCWFKDRIYLATMTMLFEYRRGEFFLPVEFGDDAPETCYRLTAADGVLWSIGSGDVFSFDGTHWTRAD